MIDEYERKRAAKGKKDAGDKRKSTAGSSDSSKKKKDDGDKPKGFGRGLDPERIIGATDSSGKRLLLSKL